MFLLISDENFAIQDNCKQKLEVDVTIKSNEKSFDKPMSKVVKRDGLSQGSQLQVYVEPSNCKRKEDLGDICESDQVTRFYEIHVKATDYGGNVVSTKGFVVIVPSLSDVKQVEDYYDGTHFENIISEQSSLFVLETVTIDWEII